MLNTRKHRALNALLTCNNLREAANKANLSERTIYSYLHNDLEFKEMYEAAKATLIDEATEQLKRNLAPAVTTLRQILDDEQTPSGTRVQAARAVLDYSIKMIEVNDILKRLEALEKPIEEVF